jgi:hypothetical protein
MKKYLPGFIAFVVAASLSSFTALNHTAKGGNIRVYWFDTSNQLQGDTPDFTTNPFNCSGAGTDCLYGYQSSTALTARPQSGDFQTVKHND